MSIPSKTDAMSEPLSIRLIEVPCPCCGDTRRDAVSRPRSHHTWLPGQFTYVECAACRQTYLCPRPDDESLSRCYARLSGWASGGTDGQPAGVPAMGVLRGLWHRLIGDSSPAMRYIGGPPLLDVGSNEGEFLLALNERNIPCEGLEFNPDAVERCRRRGLIVHQGDVDSIDLPRGHYGTITLVHTLEHFGNPVAALAKLFASLRPGGRVVVIVPHIRSPMRYLLGDDWQGWDPPFHLAHYDGSNLRRVAERAGGRLVRSSVLGSVEDVRRSINIRFGRRSRGLFLRAAALPFVKGAEMIGLGGVLVGEITREQSAQIATRAPDQ